MMITLLKSAKKEVKIGSDRPFVMIGEKINPTGHKKLAAALTEENFDYVREVATRQVAWGADVLDVNVGVPGIDEPAMMKKIVELVISVTDVPLCIDSGNPEVLAAGLGAAPGKPLVNSVAARRSSA
jgi:5-methyltetrahydrofolate--homocysteine methyltransferase